MYQPYIRGKQFELIGIRELIPTVLEPNKTKISPIIEPVKNSSTLKTTLSELIRNDINFTLIVNPRVGSFKNHEGIFEILKQSIGNSTNYQVGVIIHENTQHKNTIEVLSEFNELIPSLTLIHNRVFENISEEIKVYEEKFGVKYNVINLSTTTKRYHRNFLESTRVELEDYFKAQSKNSDYLRVDESYFTEEHLFYKAEGFVGFSDFLSIGEEYSESGFLPYAVAIHLSYPEHGTNKIKIKHFVSNSNDDTSDIAGKFEEALDKLIYWCDNTGYNSIAIPYFRQFHRNGHFPGLGTLKKLSLMNHIDLVLKLI